MGYSSVDSRWVTESSRLSKVGPPHRSVSPQIPGAEPELAEGGSGWDDLTFLAGCVLFQSPSPPPAPATNQFKP